MSKLSLVFERKRFSVEFKRNTNKDIAPSCILEKIKWAILFFFAFLKATVPLTINLWPFPSKQHCRLSEICWLSMWYRKSHTIRMLDWFEVYKEICLKLNIFCVFDNWIEDIQHLFILWECFSSPFYRCFLHYD